MKHSTQIFLVICGLAFSNGVLAADGKKKADTTDPIGRTDVIGSKEAPAVYNVVPWKDKTSVAPPKKDVSTSILKDSIAPLDHDEMHREILLQDSLGTQ